MTARSSVDALRPFQLEGVRDTGNTVGDGSYATVKELNFRGLKCVGKKIHAILYNSASPQEKAALLERFASECQLLSRLHHPCIVQFLGVYFEQDSQLPVMVMEYLHTTLSACLDQGVLPEEISYEILRDVILGLRYIHEHLPPIIHRDLSANNVLLTPNMSAKISDLGMAKILNINPARLGLMTQTQTPGTPSYMPPEAMVARPKYTNKVDIFSYGVMMVHILSGEWPIPGEAFREDPNDPESNIPLSEFERRAEYLQNIRRNHPLMGLIRQCLNNVPSRRPEAMSIHETIGAALAGLPPSFSNRLEMLQRIRSLSAQLDMLSSEASVLSTSLSDTTSLGSWRGNTVSFTGSNSAVESLQVQVESLRAEVQRLSLGMAESQPTSPGQMLNPQSKFRWKRCADMPVAMSYPQLVRINNDVYVGGGHSKTLAHTLCRYSPAGDTWTALPKCPTRMFGLTEIECKPVLLGGVPLNCTTAHTPCDDVYTLENSQEWRKTLPPLPTARFYPTVFRYKSFLIACGGITSYTDGNHTCTAAVEVFSSKTSQWYKAEPLPTALHAMSHTIINDACYLIGGSASVGLSNRAFCAYLPSLIQQATAQANPQSPTASSPPSAIWRELTECSLYQPTAASVGGCLLAIGGQRSGVASSRVYVYSPNTNLWQPMPNAELPEARLGATATQLASGSIILVGGKVESDLCSTALIASIEG